MRVKSKAMPLRLLGMAVFAVAVLLSVSVLPAQAALAADSDPVHITVDKGPRVAGWRLYFGNRHPRPGCY